MKVKILAPPNDTLLSSMLYEGYMRIVGECGEEAREECVREVLGELGKKEIRFRFVGNDVRHTLGKISKKFPGVTLRNDVRDLLNFLANLLGKIRDLRIDVKLSEDSLLVGAPDFTDEKEGYSFQIMKVDRYGGVSSVESGLFKEDVTTYADLSGLLMFFTGLASSYVTSVRTDHYFLLFDVDTLLSYVLVGNIKGWMDIKDHLLEDKIRSKIERYGGINDEAITLSVLYDVLLLEELERSHTSYVGFRLVKVSAEGQTYKVYTSMPLRVYAAAVEKDIADEIDRIVDTLIEPAARFVRGLDVRGDGYNAFKALRYLYLFATTGNPSYLNMMYRELHEAYVKSGSPRYLTCFLRKPIARR